MGSLLFSLLGLAGCTVHPKGTLDTLFGNSFSITLTPSEGGSKGEALTFSAQIVHGAAPFQLTWDFGDSTIGVGDVSMSHAYTAGGTYNVTVSVEDAKGKTAATSISVVITDDGASLTGPDTTAPSAPTNVAITQPTSTSLRLGWTAATDNVGVTGYLVDVSLNNGFTTFVTGYQNKSVGTALAITVAGLSQSTVYYARVRAKDAKGNISANSATSTGTTQNSSTCSETNTTDLTGINFFTSDSPWNTPVDTAPLDPNSATIVANSVPDAQVIAETSIPFNVVSCVPAGVNFTFNYDADSDKVPYPVPANPRIEAPDQLNDPNVDHHLLIVNRNDNKLYEVYQARKQGGQWFGAGGAVFDLGSNGLRPAPPQWTYDKQGYSSSDAAGLPILPGLLRYEEVLSGEIKHALRVTLTNGSVANAFVPPATHFTTSGLDSMNYAPMGARFRLKASFDISPYRPEFQVILRALKKYGVFNADNGRAWAISAAPDSRWIATNLAEYQSGFYLWTPDFQNSLKGSDFELVKMGTPVKRWE